MLYLWGTWLWGMVGTVCYRRCWKVFIHLTTSASNHSLREPRKCATLFEVFSQELQDLNLYLIQMVLNINRVLSECSKHFTCFILSDPLQQPWNVNTIILILQGRLNRSGFPRATLWVHDKGGIRAGRSSWAAGGCPLSAWLLLLNS